jgi:hypothetical protein
LHKLLFIDSTKAYDSIPLNKLWETLDGLAINTMLIEAIIALYEGFSSKIKIGNLITKGFKVTKELRQGCSLSPTFFKNILRKSVKELEKEMPTNRYNKSKHTCIFQIHGSVHQR